MSATYQHPWDIGMLVVLLQTKLALELAVLYHYIINYTNLKEIQTLLQIHWHPGSGLGGPGLFGRVAL